MTMMRVCRAAMGAVGLLVCLVGRCEALGENVEQLVKACDAGLHEQTLVNYKAGVCLSSIEAYSNMMAVIGMDVEGPNKKLRNMSLCWYDNVVPAPLKLVGVFMQWAAAHPEHASKPAFLGVIVALSERYPCIKPKP